jgi:hypothetical protein
VLSVVPRFPLLRVSVTLPLATAPPLLLDTVPARLPVVTGGACVVATAVLDKVLLFPAESLAIR